jgi:hypothetical protein
MYILMKRYAFLLLLALLTMAMAVGEVAACPGCKEALAGQEGNGDSNPWLNFGDVGAAYSYSVLFMLGMLTVTASGFAAMCYRLYRKQARLLPPAEPPDEPFPK